MELEPLSEEAALESIDTGQNSVDARWLDWIVETAGLTELPLYLQLTRQLFRRDLLDYLPADRSARVDMRSMDHSKLRLHLLDTWMEALFDGHLMDAVPLNRGEREAVVEWLSALACIGMIGDTIEVKYDDYYEGGRARSWNRAIRRDTGKSTARSRASWRGSFVVPISGGRSRGETGSTWWRRTVAACVSRIASCRRISHPVS